MDIFEFLMIMQSIIVGLGLSELLTNFSRVLKTKSRSQIGFIVPTLSAVIFIALLQSFWETWGLQSFAQWSFPSLLLMISGPVILHMLAHIIYPDVNADMSLTEHYLAHTTLIYTLTILTVLASVLFRPLALDMPLIQASNLQSFIIIAAVVPLLIWKNIWLHRVIVGGLLLSVVIDILLISYEIG